MNLDDLFNDVKEDGTTNHRSKVFRGKLIYYMKQEKLDFYKEIEDLKISQEFDKLISSELG